MRDSRAMRSADLTMICVNDGRVLGLEASEGSLGIYGFGVISYKGFRGFKLKGCIGFGAFGFGVRAGISKPQID